MTFYGLLKEARRAQLSDGTVNLSWIEAMKLAELGERLEIELSELKQDLAHCSKVIDREQVRLLKKGLDA